MRAAEALLLGRDVIKHARGYVYNKEDNSGCALGMIIAANGGLKNFDLGMFCEIPCLQWMRDEDYRVPLPCGCFGEDFTVINAVTHIFDEHVIGPLYVTWPPGSGFTVTDYKPWTIEMLADWLEKVEPDEPEDLVPGFTHNRPAAVTVG